MSPSLVENKPPAVILEDETLRDGLQSVKRILDLEDKIELAKGLIESGFRRIQIGSFVNPARVPQMADTEKLIEKLGDCDVLLTGLVLNERGLVRAQSAGLGHISLSFSISDTHSRANTNRPSAQAFEETVSLVKRAADAGLSVRAGIQCAFGCIWEGMVEPSRIIEAAGRLVEAGAKEINLADTTGQAAPPQVGELVKSLGEIISPKGVSLHLHDTRGLGLANAWSAYQAGARIFDVCAGGLGGCPFVPDAAGNIAAEDTVNLFAMADVETGVDPEALCRVVARLEQLIDQKLPGRICRVLKAGQQIGCKA